jgi:uncharacterized protein (TIGR02687 family)
MNHLREKIQTPFKNNPKLRMLFFFDEKQAYRDELFALDLPNIQIIDASGAHFALKLRLEYELKDDKVLLYFPYAAPSGTSEKVEFILLDLLLANKELLLDELADFLETYQLHSNQRHLLSQFINELKSKNIQAVLQPILNPESFTEKNIVQGLLSVFLGFNRIVSDSLLLAKLLTLSLPKNKAIAVLFFRKAAGDTFQEKLKHLLRSFLEIYSESVSPELLKSAVNKLKYNLITQNILTPAAGDPYKQLRFTEPNSKSRLNALYIDWTDNKTVLAELESVLQECGDDIQDKILLDTYGLDHRYFYYNETMVWAILHEKAPLLKSQAEKITGLMSYLTGKRPWREETDAMLRFLSAAADYYSHLTAIKSYILDTPADDIRQYTEIFYLVDQRYRSAVLLLQNLGQAVLPDSFPWDKVTEEFHSSYEDFLIRLNRDWLKCLEQEHFRFENIPVKHQYDFYRSFLSGSEQKAAVIISDALRYEAAAALYSELISDPRGNARLSPLLSALPSTTQLGMANLLSDEPLHFENNGVFVKELSTEGIQNRQKILQKYEPEARAIQYTDLMQMNQEEARSLFKSPLVYIYHNVIDAIGDDRKSEMRTFNAVSDAISEISSLVKKIHASYNVARVLITADHGFLFNYRPLPDALFQEKPKGSFLAEHNRYLISEQKLKTNEYYQIPMCQAAKIDSNAYILLPKSINRFRHQGSGVHFVHGGASLQEMVIPLIESNRKREEVVSKVSLRLLNEELKVLSGSLRINILQTESVTEKKKALDIVAGLYSSTNELISNELKLRLGSTEKQAPKRMQSAILTLNTKGGRSDLITLKIFNADDKDRLNPLISENVINKTLIDSDF